MRLTIPAELAASCRRSPERWAWLTRLPALVGEFERRWGLTVGAPFEEAVSCSWVAPARRSDGTECVLKVAMPHMEGAHEIQGLRFWDGDGMVRLLDAEEESGAMLLERCLPGTPLSGRPEAEQDVAIAGLLRRLWRKPPEDATFRPLAFLMNEWSRETLADRERWPDNGIVSEGLRLFAELPRTAPEHVLLATDLHAGNVLRAEREPWLAIDPKPFVGDPAYDLTQHLMNCDARLTADARGAVRRMADLAEVDEERVRLWTFARLAAGPWHDRAIGWRLAAARALAK